MKVAILTNMMDFNPGYSLTGIIKDQTIMLTRYGHDVHLFVNEQFNKTNLDDFSHVTVHQSIPFAHLKDYTSIGQLSEDHKKTVNDTAEMLVDSLQDFDVVFTHDFIFTGWFLPYGLGTVQASKELPNAQFMHWIHSIPSASRDWWNIKSYGPNHKLVFPNNMERLQVAEQYKGTMSDVRTIPHIKDIRTWADFSDDTVRAINFMPKILEADVVQILPAGTDRLSSKGVHHVISIFGRLKEAGANVCLVVANPWATGRNRKQSIDPYIALAKEVGLVYGEDFMFTSDMHPDWENGIGKQMLRELFMCSSLFIFPTREESFGLVVPEAALAGSCLLVLNKSLDQQVEISGGQAVYFNFGSFNREFKNDDINKYYKDLASIILGRIQQNEAVKTKMWFKTHNNYDYLYRTYYKPIITDLTCKSL